MHKEILTKNQKDLLPLLKAFSSEFYLVGGTAIALYLGHRHSIDFDLFTTNEIHRLRIKRIIEASGFHINQVLYEAFDQLHYIVNSVKITFFNFPYRIDATENFENIISIPSLLDLAAMKAFSLGGRAKWKDYVDLYLLFKDFLSFQEVVSRASHIFGREFNEKLFREQLTYYEDIDDSEAVDFVAPPVPEKEIKAFLTEIALRPFD